MTEREVRMRAIEALSTMGVRASQDLIRHAEPVVEWIMAAEDKGIPPRAAKKANGDKVIHPS